MPYFLTQDQIYRLIQRELPAEVFPDGPPTAFFHTAEMYSYALNMQSAYQNASGIYQNFFPQSCDEFAINQWEIKVFGQLNTDGISLAARQALVLQKIRTNPPGISERGIETVINFTIPGLVYEIACWCCGNGQGGWVLNVSQLDLETYLNYNAQFAQPVGEDLCSKVPADYGMTEQQWHEIQLMAYTYEVRIYGVTLTAMQKAILNAALNQWEPARSNHIINDGLDPSQMLNVIYPLSYNWPFCSRDAYLDTGAYLE